MISQPLPSHDQAHEYLRKARERGRLSHAYLLVGAPGTGKTRLCLDFSRTLFCENGARGGCDCRQCRSIEHGNHPGVTEYGPPEGKKIIDIDTIREVSERSHYRRDHTFIAIIEGAERMSNPAMNAILKTLEEPAGDFIIMLTAASTGNLLPTVVSRCHRLYLGSGCEAGLAEDEAGPLLEKLILEGWGSGDPSGIISEMIPEAENDRERVQRILGLLLDWSRSGMEEAEVSVLDTLSAFQEDILELRRALDGNVQADLIMEQALKRARPVGGLLSPSNIR